MGNFLSGSRSLAPDSGPPLETPADLPWQLAPYWKTVCAQMPEGIAVVYDTQIVITLCQSLYLQDKAMQSIIQSGIDAEDAAHGGDMRRNPNLITWRQAADKAIECMNLLGMSPISRKRIQAGDGERVDPFLEFLRRRDGSATRD